MKLLSKIKSSIYDPQYYQGLTKRPFSYSVKYIFSFTFILALLLMIEFSIFTLPQFMSGLNELGSSVVNNYPEELQVVIKDGTASTNVKEPYYIENPDSLKETEVEIHGNTPKNLVVIDTKNKTSVEDLQKYDTFFLITKTHFMYQEESGKITAQSLVDMPDVVIDKASVSRFVDEYSPYLKFFIPIAYVGILIFVYVYVLFNLVYLLFAALLVWFVSSLKKIELDYKGSYQVSMHLMTLPALVGLLLPVTFPFAFTFLLLGGALVNLQSDSAASLDSDVID